MQKHTVLCVNAAAASRLVSHPLMHLFTSTGATSPKRAAWRGKTPEVISARRCTVALYSCRENLVRMILENLGEHLNRSQRDTNVYSGRK